MMPKNCKRCGGDGLEPSGLIDGGAWCRRCCVHSTPDPDPEPETQESIGRWARETFPGGDDASPVHALRVLEEVIELCRAAGASWAEIERTARKSFGWHDGDLFNPDRCWPDPAGLPGEAADVAISLDVAASRYGVDRAAEVDAKMVLNRAREWVARGDGTGHHARKDGE